MSNTALKAARHSVFRKLEALANAWAAFPSWEEVDAEDDPKESLRFADTLDVRVDKLITGISLMRHAALAAIRERKEGPR